METNLNSQIAKGFFWLMLDKIGNYGIRFVITIILARLLLPEEFGIIVIMTIFTSIMTVFSDSGFTIALIQKQDTDQIDYCSVFYVNILISCVLYALLFILSPYIEAFYENEGLSLYLHIFSIIIVIRSFSLIQNMLLRKKMLFHLSFRINWIAFGIAGAIGIIMAYCGYGIWSLIVQQITNVILAGIMQWTLIKWKPQLQFNWNRLKSLYSFGWKMFCSNLLEVLYNDIYSVIIGKIADLKMLSYYDRGKQYPLLGMNIVNSTLSTVLLPAFSKIQNDHTEMKKLAKQGMRNVMFFVAPGLAFLFVYADVIVKVLLTEKWSPCVIFLRLSCLFYFFYPIHTINLQVITAAGRSDMYLALEIIKRLQAIISIAITYRFGVIVMVIVAVSLEPLFMIENAWACKKMIRFSFFEQIIILLPTVTVVILTSAASYLLTSFIGNAFLKILLGFCSFGLLFLIISYFTKSIPEEVTATARKFFKWNAANR